MMKKNFLVGMGMGIVAGGAFMACIRPKRPTVKSTLGKALKTMSEMADSVCGAIGK